MKKSKKAKRKSPGDEDVKHPEVKIEEGDEDDDDVIFVGAADPPIQPTTSQESNNAMYCLKQLESIPIVYTTRLDDMQLRLPRNLEPRSFFEKIIHKSRPKLTNDSLKNQTPHVEQPESYMQLKQTIENVNRRICRKLLSIKREKQQGYKAPRKKPLPQLLTLQIIPPDENSTQQPITTIEKKRVKYNIYSYSYRSNYFLIRNTSTNKADIYYFNENGAVTQHFSPSSTLDSLYTPTIKNAEIPYCCWYQHEEILSLMRRYLPPPTLKYLRKPHPCKSQCTCCCQVKVDSRDEVKEFSDSLHTPTDPMDKGTVKLTAERMVAPKKLNVLIEDMLNMCSTGTSPLTLISKAFAFRPQITQVSRLGSTGSGFGLNRNSTFDKKTYNIFMDYTNGGNEYYQIGSDGEVREHLKNVSQCFIQKGLASYENCECKKICCWQNREYFIQKLKGMNILPKPKYLKSPHKCPTDNCICCCKPLGKPKLIDNLKEINLPEVPNFSENPYNKIPPLKFVFANNEPVIPNHVIAELEESLPSSSKAKTDLSTAKEEDLTLLNSQYKLICENAKYLVESKISKFKETYICVNDKGKITATLNFPVTKLATNELKILSDILNQAQRSVDLLKKASDKSNIILNNTAIPKRTETEVKSNNERIPISQSKQPPVEPTKSNMYALMSMWSEIQDDNTDTAMTSFFRIQTYKISSKQSRKRKRRTEIDFGHLENLNKIPRKQRTRYPKGIQQANMPDIIEPDIEADSLDSMNDESVDPLAFNNDNSLNHTTHLTKTDPTTSYIKSPLLNAETEDISTAIPITIIKKCVVNNVMEACIQPLRPDPLQVPANPTPVVLNSIVTDLEEQIPVTSIVNLNVKEEPQILTENNDCILGA